MKYRIIPHINNIIVEGSDACDAMNQFVSAISKNPDKYLLVVPDSYTHTAEMHKLKAGDKFQVLNGTVCIASTDAHYNVDEDCWIVYDETGNCWFEEDFLL